MRGERVMQIILANILALLLVGGGAWAQGRIEPAGQSGKPAAVAAPAAPQAQAPETSRPRLPEQEISFAAVGDVMLGSAWPNGGWLPPDDGAGLLAEVAPILSASDITFGNLEGPMVDDGTSTKCPEASSRCYAFRVPTRYGRYLRQAALHS